MFLAIAPRSWTGSGTTDLETSRRSRSDLIHSAGVATRPRPCSVYCDLWNAANWYNVTVTFGKPLGNDRDLENQVVLTMMLDPMRNDVAPSCILCIRTEEPA